MDGAFVQARQVRSQACAAAGTHHRCTNELPQRHAAPPRAGMGIGLLEERYAGETTGDGRLKVLEGVWEIELGLVYRADHAEDTVAAGVRQEGKSARGRVEVVRPKSPRAS